MPWPAADSNISTQPIQGRQADRQTGRQADRQTGRQADRQTGRLADRQTGRQADRQTGRPADRQTDRQADRQTSRQGRSMSTLSCLLSKNENHRVLMENKARLSISKGIFR